jgi:hypothetical protein
MFIIKDVVFKTKCIPDTSERSRGVEMAGVSVSIARAVGVRGFSLQPSLVQNYQRCDHNNTAY